MNQNTKKAAVKKYGALKDEGQSKEQIFELLKADEKEFAEDEIAEIIDALFTESGEQGQSNKPNANKKFEEWKVKPIYEKKRVGDDGTMRNVCTGFEKDAQTYIRVTNISQERADLLNTQSENTLVRLYEAK